LTWTFGAAICLTCAILAWAAWRADVLWLAGAALPALAVWRERRARGAQPGHLLWPPGPARAGEATLREGFILPGAVLLRISAGTTGGLRAATPATMTGYGWRALRIAVRHRAAT
jgi:hypothetical protein